MVDYYATLEIDKGADYTVIRKAYKKKALQYHPDKNRDKDTSELFKNISEAYQVLSDPELRKKYDSKQKIHTSFLNPNIIFRNFFSKMDPALCNYLKDAFVFMSDTLLDKDKDIGDIVDGFTSPSFIDKTTHTMNDYLKRKVAANGPNTHIFNYNITMDTLEEYYNDEGELAININYDFLRKYTHISFTINTDKEKKTFLLDLIFTDFDINFNKKNYKIAVYNNFLDNMSRKPNSPDIYLSVDVYIQDYLNGFLFKYSLSDLSSVTYNISLGGSNIIRIANMGLLYDGDAYGNLYVVFRPTNIFSSQLPMDELYDTLYSVEYI